MPDWLDRVPDWVYPAISTAAVLIVTALLGALATVWANRRSQDRSSIRITVEHNHIQYFSEPVISEDDLQNLPRHLRFTVVFENNGEVSQEQVVCSIMIIGRESLEQYLDTQYPAIVSDPRSLQSELTLEYADETLPLHSFSENDRPFQKLTTVGRLPRLNPKERLSITFNYDAVNYADIDMRTNRESSRKELSGLFLKTIYPDGYSQKPE